MSQFNPDDVQINLALNYKECNLILKALGKLPFEDVAELYSRVRTVGTTTMNAAGEAFQRSLSAPQPEQPTPEA